jgi:hypothetical protein
MSKKLIIVLIYHHHKLSDLIYMLSISYSTEYPVEVYKMQRSVNTNIKYTRMYMKQVDSLEYIYSMSLSLHDILLILLHEGYSPQSSAEVKNRGAILPLPIRLHGLILN